MFIPDDVASGHLEEVPVAEVHIRIRWHGEEYGTVQTEKEQLELKIKPKVEIC